MNRDQPSPRALVRVLHDLRRAEPPATLLPTVLRTTGLADSYIPLETPVGNVFIAWNSRGITAVMRREDASTFSHDFAQRFQRRVIEADAKTISTLRPALEAAVHGERKAPMPFDLHTLTPFEQAVLRKALEIPRGQVRPYGWIAREIGNPRAVRAVGSALKHNPIPLLIPCHRVVLSDGRLGQYAMGGTNIKRALLEEEGAEPETLEMLAQQHIQFFGNITTNNFCFPTCRHARRVAPQHQVPFASAREAVAKGYRPCKVCRPA
ncbi:MAG TPA: methylated-DNA--[protein]-cysteine S-methyltransferase [Ktedonobacterales bacterium]|nr:methylated-DNA--[protein]-cysteine S-methyltransferase [Ktedonobacterales bacterium]